MAERLETKAGPHPAPKTPGLVPFGAFLVAHGIIGSVDLRAAMAIQGDRRARIGLLARQHQLLTHENIIAIIEYQKGRRQVRFGEAAVKLGLLNELEVAHLIEEQADNQPLLGELLVQLGALTEKRLEQALTLYVQFLHELDQHAEPSTPSYFSSLT